MDNLEKLQNQMEEKEKELELIRAAVQDQALKEMVGFFERGLTFSKGMAEYDKTNEEVKKVFSKCKGIMKDLVKILYGDEYKITKSGQPAGKGDAVDGDFEWNDLADRMREKGVTSKDNAMARSELEEIVFGKGGLMKFRASRWNNTKEREQYLVKVGNSRRDTKYYIKGK